MNRRFYLECLEAKKPEDTSPCDYDPKTFRVKRLSSGRKGAAVVEFAIVALLFLLLLAGIIEFGQAFRIQHTVSNASRRAVRACIVDGAIASDVIQDAKAQCTQTLTVNETAVTVEITVNGASPGDLTQAEAQDEIGVTVSIPFSEAGAGFFANMFSSAVISSTCTLEHE